MMIQKNIKKLVQYGLNTGLIEPEDKIYTTNRLLELFRLEELEDGDEDVTMEVEELETVLGQMLDYAYEAGIMTENSIVYRDLFDTKIMGMLVPRPSEVIARFHALYEKSPKEATDYFYQLSKNTDYIRRDISGAGEPAQGHTGAPDHRRTRQGVHRRAGRGEPWHRHHRIRLRHSPVAQG